MCDATAWPFCFAGSYLYLRNVSIAALRSGAGPLSTFIELTCPDVNLFHIVVWHWGVLLIGTAFGALIGAAAEYIQQRPTPKPSRAGGLVPRES